MASTSRARRHMAAVYSLTDGKRQADSCPPALEAANGQRQRCGTAGDSRAGHAAHVALHVHRVAVRRRSRPGLRGRAGRLRGRDDDEPDVTLRAPAPSARRNRAAPAATTSGAPFRYEGFGWVGGESLVVITSSAGAVMAAVLGLSRQQV